MGKTLLPSLLAIAALAATAETITCIVSGSTARPLSGTTTAASGLLDGCMDAITRTSSFGSLSGSLDAITHTSCSSALEGRLDRRPSSKGLWIIVR